MVSEGNWRKFKSTFEVRHKWLLDHPELHDKDRRIIIAAMKKVGLVSKSTYFADVRIWCKSGIDSKEGIKICR